MITLSIIARDMQELILICPSAPILDTQLRALKEITELAFDDPFLRSLLSNSPVKRYLMPNFGEPELHVASVKAMVCVEEVEVHTLFKNLQRLWMRKIALGPRGTSDQIFWSKGVERCEQRIGELVW